MENTMPTFWDNAKDFCKGMFLRLRYWILAMPMLLVGSPVAFADTNVQENAPTVGNNGEVGIKGGGGDAHKAVSSLMHNGQFWLGVAAGVAGLLIMGFGIWQAWKNAKAIQEGNSAGWTGVGWTVGGTIVGGLLLAIIGAVLGIGAATGSNFFK